MDDATRVSAAKAAWDTSAGTERRGPRHGIFRRAFRTVVHFLSYKFILSRPTIRETYAAGFRLNVRPTVFHPKYFISSETLRRVHRYARLHRQARLRDRHRHRHLRARGRAGRRCDRGGDRHQSERRAVGERERHGNGLGDRVTGVCTNLMAAIAPRPLFDVILSSPPKHAGEPKDLTDRGWHAGPEYRDITALFEQARDRLKPDG